LVVRGEQGGEEGCSIVLQGEAGAVGNTEPEQEVGGDGGHGSLLRLLEEEHDCCGVLTILLLFMVAVLMT
jgi:hypothetical protein